MKDLRLYLLGEGTRPTWANDQILSRSAGPLDASGARFTARWMPGGLNDRGLRAGELEQPQHHPPLKLFARQRALSQHMASATSLRPTLGGPVGMDVKACTPAGSCFVPKLAVARDGPTSRRRMLAALDVTAETIVASTQRGPSGKSGGGLGTQRAGMHCGKGG
jgi:hypothetical protein